MQIGLECFMDEQISSMIASENRHGECEIQGKKECIVYDTNEDHYLEGYLEEIMDAFTVAKHLRVSETDARVGYLHTFLARWKVFKVDEKSIQKIIKYVANVIKMSRNCLMKKLQLENYFQQMKWSVSAF